MMAEMKLPQAKLRPFLKVYDSSSRQAWPKLEQIPSSWAEGGGRGECLFKFRFFPCLFNKLL